jgi:hypothetical protein
MSKEIKYLASVLTLKSVFHFMFRFHVPMRSISASIQRRVMT